MTIGKLRSYPSGSKIALTTRRIMRPEIRLALGGVVRLFVFLSGVPIEVDILLPGEGRGVLQDPAEQSENLQVGSATVSCLKVGPMLKTKLKAYTDRQGNNDFEDLRFLCTDRDCSLKAREHSGEYNEDQRREFARTHADRFPHEEEYVRWVLRVPRIPCP